MQDFSNLIRAATHFINTHPTHHQFQSLPKLDTTKSSELIKQARDAADKANNLPKDRGYQRPTDTQIALALLPALLGQNPRYLGNLISGYHHGMGEELARQRDARKQQQQALLGLSQHYMDGAKLSRAEEVAKFSEANQNLRTESNNRQMVDVAANNAKRIAVSASKGRLTPEQSDALRQFNLNMSGIADGPEGWTESHQTAYLRALDHLRKLPVFSDNPGVVDTHVKSFPVGYKSLRAVASAQDSYHRFLSSIYHPGIVTEADVRRSHAWLNKNVPEAHRWQFVIPQEGETWQSASKRLNRAEQLRSQRAGGVSTQPPTQRPGPVSPMTPKFDGQDWIGTGPIGSGKPGTLPRVKPLPK